MSDCSAATPHSKDHPFAARLSANRLLNGPGSAKETRHFVIDLKGSGLSYKAGDSLGVFPTNRPMDVERVIAALHATGEEPVMLPKATASVSLRDALLHSVALAGPTRKFVEAVAARTQGAADKARLEALLAPESKEVLETWLDEREFLDILEEFPGARFTPQEFVELLRRLMPRLYSIASSPRMHPEEVHLTVAVVRYTTNHRERVGVCSTFLADRLQLGVSPVPVFVSHSHFAPPEDTGRDMIMIGPGTGIAPFRAFMQERQATGAKGRNWLFFGDQRRATDFLYEEDWMRWQAEGLLTRIDTAFSRDQLMKVYVQDRMRENAAELWAWIKQGAAFYVCGDAKRMAKDVDVALHDVIAGQGAMSPAQAADYVKQMKKEKRYQRDVY